VRRKAEHLLNVGSQQQVNVMSMEDDEFSTDDEHVCSRFCYTKSQVMLVCCVSPSCSLLSLHILLYTQHVLCSTCYVELLILSTLRPLLIPYFGEKSIH